MLSEWPHMIQGPQSMCCDSQGCSQSKLTACGVTHRGAIRGMQGCYKRDAGMLSEWPHMVKRPQSMWCDA